MTGEEARRFQDEWLAAHPNGMQDEHGDDVSLIRESLRLSVSERFARYERSARLALEVFNAGKRAGLHNGL